MSDVKAQPLIDTLLDILPPTKVETNLGTPGHVKCKAVVDTMAKAVHEAKAKTLLDTL